MRNTIQVQKELLRRNIYLTRDYDRKTSFLSFLWFLYKEKNLFYFLKYKHNTQGDCNNLVLLRQGFAGLTASFKIKNLLVSRFLIKLLVLLCTHCEALAKQWNWGELNSRVEMLNQYIYVCRLFGVGRTLRNKQKVCDRAPLWIRCCPWSVNNFLHRLYIMP